jgi:hypothetical protein
MKKLILVLAATATLAGGQALAQANLPQFTGVQPGVTHPEYPQAYGNSGWTPDMAYGNNNYPYHSGQVPFVLSDGRWVLPQAVVPAYRPSSRDRDGDGVRNSRDRYPDDPRYR